MLLGGEIQAPGGCPGRSPGEAVPGAGGEAGEAGRGGAGGGGGVEEVVAKLGRGGGVRLVGFVA